MSTCLFCRIIRREIPASIVYEDDRILAFNDIEPRAPIHVLVIPKRHLDSLNAATETDDALLGALTRVAAHIAAERGIADTGFRTVFNTNRDAGQTVFHTSLGAKNAGSLDYEWNGIRDNGQPAASGKYTVKISATIDNVPTALTPAVTARVDSVSLGRNGLPPTLNVNGYGAVDMADVLEIQ